MKTVLAGLGMAAFTVLMLAQAPAASAAAADGVINDLRAEDISCNSTRRRRPR